MNKPKKNAVKTAFAKQITTPAGFSENGREPNADNPQPEKASKPFNGIWIALLMLGFLVLLFVQHWLRQ